MIDIAVVTAAFEHFTAAELEQIESLAREARHRRQDQEQKKGCDACDCASVQIPVASRARLHLA